MLGQYVGNELTSHGYDVIFNRTRHEYKRYEYFHGFHIKISSEQLQIIIIDPFDVYYRHETSKEYKKSVISFINDLRRNIKS